MTDWKEYKLGEIASEIGDGLHGTPNYSENGDYYFINGNNISDGRVTIKSDTKKVDKKEFEKYKKPLSSRTILMSINGTIGNVGFYNNEKCVLGKSACYLNIKNGIDKYFIYYTFLTEDFQSHLLNIATGTTIQNVPLKGLRDSIILLPPLDEQRHIAAILSSFDDKIDLLHRENATLEQMAETLFRQWFVAEAKVEWEEGKLGDEFDFTMGQSPNGDSFNEEGIGVPMYQGNADFGFRFPTRRVFTTQPTRFAEVNDTLISVRAPVGAQNMATERCCIGRGVAAFRYKSNPSYYSYTYYKLKSLLEEIRQFNDNGTVFGSISKSDFENLDIMIPDDETIEMFQKQVKVIDDKIINNNNEIQTLIQTRDGLLPRLMGGELKI